MLSVVSWYVYPYMGYCAIALERKYYSDTQAVQVIRAVDCGQIVSPDDLRNQVEGGIVQSTSWTLYEAVDFDQDGVRSIDWASYPIMRFSQVPTDRGTFDRTR
jgi:nicotinate dehydrogenase subunit B